MKEITDADIQALVDDIVATVHPSAVYLFGSRARGDHRADSDVDLMVVVPEAFFATHDRYQTLSSFYQLAIKYHFPIDFLLYSDAEINMWHATRSHVIYHALTEGHHLYDAA
jgi:predicted nucleotidyltransferase